MDIPNFRDLTDHSILEGDKIKLEDLLNKPIVVKGVDFCGYRHFKDYVLVRKSTSKRIIRRVNNIRNEIENGKYNEEHLLGQIASTNGIIKHSNGYNLRKSLDLDKIKDTILERRTYGRRNVS